MKNVIYHYLSSIVVTGYPDSSSYHKHMVLLRTSVEDVFIHSFRKILRGFPGGAVVESPPADAGDTGSSPGLGGSHMPRSN